MKKNRVRTYGHRRGLDLRGGLRLPGNALGRGGPDLADSEPAADDRETDADSGPQEAQEVLCRLDVHRAGILNHSKHGVQHGFFPVLRVFSSCDRKKIFARAPGAPGSTGALVIYPLSARAG